MTETPSVISQPANLRIAAADGYSLAATIFDAGANHTVVLVNSATGVPRRFYERFAAIYSTAAGAH